jgi:hypothetical protein
MSFASAGVIFGTTALAVSINCLTLVIALTHLNVSLIRDVALWASQSPAGQYRELPAAASSDRMIKV